MMKFLSGSIMITVLAFGLALPSVVYCQIYKWVDENGTVHFSDKPFSSSAEKFTIQGSGISVHRETSETDEVTDEQPKAPTTPKEKRPDPVNKEITEADYRITSSASKLGGDGIQISGRIGSGPRCREMTVTATAKTETGKSATITDNIDKPNSYGSVPFSGSTKVSGSAIDFGFWKVTDVKVRCNDPK